MTLGMMDGTLAPTPLQDKEPLRNKLHAYFLNGSSLTEPHK